MFLNKVEFEKVILLRNNEAAAYDSFMRKCYPSGVCNVVEVFEKIHNSEEGRLYNEADIELCSYIESLDCKSILDLEALMLFGREWPTLKDEYSPSAAYERIREDLFSSFGTNFNKSNAAEYISSKAPLNGYLYSALEVLHPFD